MSRSNSPEPSLCQSFGTIIITVGTLWDSLCMDTCIPTIEFLRVSIHPLYQHGGLLLDLKQMLEFPHFIFSQIGNLHMAQKTLLAV